MTRRSILLGIPALLLAVASSEAGAQQLGEGMDRSGTVDIHNDNERRVFGDLQCTCGCPRESLATCTCGFAGGFRSEVREMMARGLTQEEVKAEWVRRYGPEALTVPANTGAKKLVYLAPLVAIAGMATFVVVVLRRFRAKSDAKTKLAPVAATARDDYDEKLDEELRRLDDE